jgi:hypothetical protein
MGVVVFAVCCSIKIRQEGEEVPDTTIIVSVFLISYYL